MHLNKIPLLRDPLLHFALIGGLLFAVDALVNTDSNTVEDIVITPNRVEHLAAVFERSWQRPPNAEEMQKLVDNFVREEVLYREALKLGLESDDTVIRRRLRLKMEFLARDLVDTIEPEPEVLAQFFRDNAERYRVPARMTFRQIYFSSDSRTAPARDAKALLARLRHSDSTTAGTDESGDSTLLPDRIAQASAEAVNKQLGPGFAEQLAGQPRGQWLGPVQSAYGEHLVFIETYEAEAAAELASVKTQVVRDWQAQAHAEVLEQQYQLLREGYRVQMDPEVRDQVAGGSALVREVAGR
ncbi:peptidyl-prolyl cis-trans isomerase [Microbulbifer sp. SA54]|uniref:peptidylprolyl isomerase n=1 Tax=Microbulbifer sp. SA54 TaxID=3401577 RepID=UPI003AACFBC3